MKKVLFIAILTVFAAITVSAQTAENLKNAWQKTITVSNSQATVIEKLFTAWGKEYPCCYVNAFNKFKETGKADKIKFGKDGQDYDLDFQVEFSSQNGYLRIMAEVQIINELTAVYWNLPNGNKLFAVSVEECHEGEETEESKYSDFCVFALAFYEYDVKKGVLTPRPEISKKIYSIAERVELPREGRDIEYSGGKIKWNGNGF